jgi:hypothetical protein
MEVLTITAIFPSAEEALAAMRHFADRGIADERLRISAGCVLHVAIAQQELNEMTAELRQLGAHEVTAAHREKDPGWMSHHSGRRTGSGVMPGEGDSEVGSTTSRR